MAVLSNLQAAPLRPHVARLQVWGRATCAQTEVVSPAWSHGRSRGAEAL